MVLCIFGCVCFWIFDGVAIVIDTNELRQDAKRCYDRYGLPGIAVELNAAAHEIEKLRSQLAEYKRVADALDDEMVKAIKERDAERADAGRYRWLRDVKCNQLILSRNEDHASCYVSAAHWIDEFAPGEFEQEPKEAVQAMKDADTIWRLQIYPITPVGFNRFYRASLDDVIDIAIPSAPTPPQEG